MRYVIHNLHTPMGVFSIEFSGDPVQVKIVPRGLGDVIAKLTSAAGIKPCEGCEKRRTTLNRAGERIMEAIRLR